MASFGGNSMKDCRFDMYILASEEMEVEPVFTTVELVGPVLGYFGLM